MNNSSNDSLLVSTPGRGRKRTRNEENWTKNRDRRKRHSSKGWPDMPSCGHNTKAYKCSMITKRDVRHFHALFYTKPSKIVQDMMIAKFCSATIPKRSRAKKEGSSRKGVTIKYFVKKATLSSGMPNKVPVCQKTFLALLGVSKGRVRNVCVNYFVKGKPITENRGGDTRSKPFEARKQAIDNFMSKLKPLELHYCRGKGERKYLASDLSINKLWRFYNAEVELEFKVKKAYFRAHVNKNFNIGFGTPAVDVCSTCLEYSEKIKRCQNQTEKSQLIVEKRVHSLRAKAFFSLLKGKNDKILQFSFDCQKNQVLPKVPDQSAYYSRQVYMYNCTVCKGSSKDKLSPDNVFIYAWTEVDSAKGSNEIVSIVYHRLLSTEIPEEINKIRLFSDGCGGQNKNSSMIGMLCQWLGCQAPKHVKSVELIFPVTGHSYMPPDRVFGAIEKDVKKKDTIIQPQEYLDIFAQHGTVIKLSTDDCPVYDWKTVTEQAIKKPGSWHFRFLPSKRFIIYRFNNNSVKVRGECAYRSDVCTLKSIFRTNQSQDTMWPEVIATGTKALKQVKIQDVYSLLNKHFGGNWKTIPELEFYKSLLPGNEEEMEEVECHNVPDDIQLHV